MQLDHLQQHHLSDLIWCMLDMGLVAKLLDLADRSLKWSRVGTCLFVGATVRL
jgi:hypothetical protein